MINNKKFIPFLVIWFQSKGLAKVLDLSENQLPRAFWAASWLMSMLTSRPQGDFYFRCPRRDHLIRLPSSRYHYRQPRASNLVPIGWIPLDLTATSTHANNSCHQRDPYIPLFSQIVRSANLSSCLAVSIERRLDFHFLHPLVRRSYD